MIRPKRSAASRRWEEKLGDPANSGKKECVRAIEEAAAYVSYGHLKVIEEITHPLHRRRCVHRGSVQGDAVAANRG
jgi:hypothetical protein